MRLGKFLTERTKSELVELRDMLNLSESEQLVFDCLAKGKSFIATADICKISTATLSNREKAITNKLVRVLGKC